MFASPCPDCGASVPRATPEGHVCDEARRRCYELFQVRLEAEEFDSELTRWLASPSGRFAIYYAERERRRVT
jgi:hypothetical protein